MIRSGACSPGGELALYQAADGTVSLEVRLERDTAWLTQAHMATLFDRDQSVIARHVRNVFAQGELAASESTMQKMHIAGSDRPVAFYSLDVIISVGYRVNSLRGKQFRILATNVLREHVVRGYTVNENRLRQLNQTIRLIADIADRRALTGDEATALLRVVADYSYALDLLDDYDHQRVRAPRTAAAPALPVTYDEAGRIVAHLRSQTSAGDLFGREKDGSLRGSLDGIMQTFAGRPTGKPWSGSSSTSSPGGTRSEILAPRRGAYRGDLRSGGVVALGRASTPGYCLAPRRGDRCHPGGVPDNSRGSCASRPPESREASRCTQKGCQTIAGGRA